MELKYFYDQFCYKQSAPMELKKYNETYSRKFYLLEFRRNELFAENKNRNTHIWLESLLYKALYGLTSLIVSNLGSFFGMVVGRGLQLCAKTKAIKAIHIQTVCLFFMIVAGDQKLKLQN